MDIETYEANTFSLIVTWSLADGTPKDLTGATAEAHAANTARGIVIPLSAAVVDGPAGQVRVSAPAFTFIRSTYELQLVVTNDGVSRTYVGKLVVRNSIKEAS